ncbi:hypothetical protein RvY_05831 [Ramazzottius varieornatus]|uniref:Uncharacterized protein n=1 Tax=Ramazzottius varieornatus TaxID=947166 RepID=A0A1D1UWW7_RAMVA|nr:hypothetical protein RvY_05831 [Ramazzottius varieornatus]
MMKVVPAREYYIFYQFKEVSSTVLALLYYALWKRYARNCLHRSKLQADGARVFCLVHSDSLSLPRTGKKYQWILSNVFYSRCYQSGPISVEFCLLSTRISLVLPRSLLLKSTLSYFIAIFRLRFQSLQLCICVWFTSNRLSSFANELHL